MPNRRLWQKSIRRACGGDPLKVIIQVSLNVPDGSGKELSGAQYEEIIGDLIEEKVELGEIPGVASCAVTFECCV